MTAVLVTGAAGGLGSALVTALVARGDRVVAIDRVGIERDDVAAYAIDLADEDAVAGALADAAARAASRSGTSSRSPAVRCRRRRPAPTWPTCRSRCSGRRSS